MTQRTRRLAWTVLALGMAAFLALNLLARQQARAMLRYVDQGARTPKPEKLSAWQKARILVTGTVVPRPHGTRTPADLNLAFEPLRIAGAGGIRLGGWYCPASSNRSTVVLLFHGYAADKSWMLPEAAAFHDLGVSTLLVDFRGSGDSSASYATIGFEESEDVASAVAYARQRFPGRRLVLYGQSMGAAAILRAVAVQGVKADGLVLEAVFDTLLNTVKNRFRAMKVPAFPNAQLLVFWGGCEFGFNGFSLRPVDDARAVRCPALFLHGTGDPRARPEDAEVVRAAIPNPATYFITFPSASHDDTAIAHPDLWRKSLNTLLDAVPPPDAN